MADLTIGKLVRAKAAGSIVGGLARQEMESSAYGDAEIAAALAALELNTAKRSYPEVDQAKLAALPTRAELTAEIEAVEGGPGMDFDAATNLAAAASLAWGTHYTADIAANVTIASFTGTPAEGSRLFWTGRVTADEAVTFSFPAARRQGVSGTVTNVQLAPGNRTMMFEFLNGAINLLDTGQTANPASGVSLADAGGYFPTPNAEAALQQLAGDLVALDDALAGATGQAQVAADYPAFTVPGLYGATGGGGGMRYYQSADLYYDFAAAAWVDTAPPTVSSIAIAANGETVTVTLSKAVTAATPATAWGGLTFEGPQIGSAVAAAYVSGNGTASVVLTLAQVAQLNELIEAAYAPVTDHPLTAANSTTLASFGEYPVANNSEVPPAGSEELVSIAEVAATASGEETFAMILSQSVAVGDSLVLIGNFAVGITAVTDPGGNAWTQRFDETPSTALRCIAWTMTATTPLDSGASVVVTPGSTAVARRVGRIIKAPNSPGGFSMHSGVSSSFTSTPNRTATLTARSAIVGMGTMSEDGPAVTGGVGVGVPIGAKLQGGRAVQVFGADTADAGERQAGFALDAAQTVARAWVAIAKEVA